MNFSEEGALLELKSSLKDTFRGMEAQDISNGLDLVFDVLVTFVRWQVENKKQGADRWHVLTEKSYIPVEKFFGKLPAFSPRVIIPEMALATLEIGSEERVGWLKGVLRRLAIEPADSNNEVRLILDIVLDVPKVPRMRIEIDGVGRDSSWQRLLAQERWLEADHLFIAPKLLQGAISPWSAAIDRFFAWGAIQSQEAPFLMLDGEELPNPLFALTKILNRNPRNL